MIDWPKRGRLRIGILCMSYCIGLNDQKSDGYVQKRGRLRIGISRVSYYILGLSRLRVRGTRGAGLTLFLFEYYNIFVTILSQSSLYSLFLLHYYQSYHLSFVLGYWNITKIIQIIQFMHWNPYHWTKVIDKNKNTILFLRFVCSIKGGKTTIVNGMFLVTLLISGAVFS